MDMRLFGTFSIGKVEDKFYVFYVMAANGGVMFSQSSPPFHTEEDAHLYLIEKAKEESTAEAKVSCIEITRSFMYVMNVSKN